MHVFFLRICRTFFPKITTKIFFLPRDQRRQLTLSSNNVLGKGVLVTRSIKIKLPRLGSCQRGCACLAHRLLPEFTVLYVCRGKKRCHTLVQCFPRWISEHDWRQSTVWTFTAYWPRMQSPSRLFILNQPARKK